MTQRDNTGSTKSAQLLARQIHREIIQLGWPVGENLGSEPELLQRYGAGRGVFREAIRLLESWQVAGMRAGRNGGLFVLRPDDLAVTHAASVFLGYASVDPGQLLAARLAIEPVCVQMAMQRLVEDDLDRLRDTLKVEHEAYGAGSHEGTHGLHVVIADMSGNPAMALFARVLTRLTLEETEFRDIDDPKAGRSARRAHEGIVEAMLTGDAALAQHRMRRHLEALLRYIESRPPREHE